MIYLFPSFDFVLFGFALFRAFHGLIIAHFPVFVKGFFKKNFIFFICVLRALQGVFRHVLEWGYNLTCKPLQGHCRVYKGIAGHTRKNPLTFRQGAFCYPIIIFIVLARFKVKKIPLISAAGITLFFIASISPTIDEMQKTGLASGCPNQHRDAAKAHINTLNQSIFLIFYYLLSYFSESLSCFP
jgi:hypothetical protein